MRIQTGRNPFARETIRKRKIYTPDFYKGKLCCDWCGNNTNTLYQYFVDSDSRAGTTDIKGVFCSIGCLNSYHN